MSDNLPDTNKPVFQIFPEMAENIKNKRCAICGRPNINISDFRDSLSRKEYAISGMCQVCQDGVFGK